MTEKKLLTVDDLVEIIRDNPGCHAAIIDNDFWILLPKGGNEINAAWENDGDPIVDPLVTAHDIDHGGDDSTVLWRGGNVGTLFVALARLRGMTVGDD